MMSLPPYVVCCTWYSWNVHDKYNRNNLSGRSETCHQRTDCMRKRCRQILISLWKKKTCKKIEWWAFHHTSCVAHYIAEMWTTSTTATISMDGPRPAIREPTAWENVVVKSLYPHTAASRCYFLAIIYTHFCCGLNKKWSIFLTKRVFLSLIKPLISFES